MYLKNKNTYNALWKIFYYKYFKIWLFFLKIEPFLMSIKYRNRIFKIKKENNNKEKICHVFGNGMSVMNTWKLVDENDYVIKINSGALIPGRTDIWLSESHPKSDIKAMKMEGLEENVRYFRMIKNFTLTKNPYCIPLMKNIWRRNVSIKVYDHDNDLIILQDYLIRPQPNDEELLSVVIEHIISDKSNVVGQIHTSLLTALVIAYKLGFKKIVIHGLDGRGSHFFHHHSFDYIDASQEYDIINFLRRSSPKINNQDKYIPGLKGLEIYEIYYKALLKRNVQIITAIDFQKIKSKSFNE